MGRLLLVSATLVGLGAATLPPNPYWPMALGNSWTYRFQGNPAGQDIETTITIEVMGRTEVAGRAYWLLSGYPGRMGPFEQNPIRVRWDPNHKRYMYLPNTGAEMPFLPMDPDDARTTSVRAGNAAGWNLAGALRYEVCHDCKNRGMDQWLIREGVGVLSRQWDEAGSWGRYVLEKAVVQGRSIYPGVTRGGINVEVRARPKADRVELEMFIRNVSDQPRHLRFPSSKRYDFRILDSERQRILWSWSAGRFFLEVFQEHYLGPGEVVHIQESWNYTRPDGRVVDKGRLFLEGDVPLIDDGFSVGPVPFEAGPGHPQEMGLSSLAEEILDAPAVAVLVDYSASMAYELGGRSKLGVVQRGIQNLFLTMPDESVVSMRVFGSDAEPGCERTELVHPLGPVNTYKALSDFLDLVPAGDSAVTRALTSAALDLRTHPGPQAIFLVTDGGDSCGEDPAATVRALAEAGYEFSLEIFGYSLNAELQAAYRRVAQSTGGDFHPFVSGVELSEALERLSSTYYQGGQVVVMSRDRPDAPILILDAYGQITARGMVGIPVTVPVGTYSVRVLGDNPEQVPGVQVNRNRRRLVFLEERLAELAAFEMPAEVNLDCIYSPDMRSTPPCWRTEEDGD